MLLFKRLSKPDQVFVKESLVYPREGKLESLYAAIINPPLLVVELYQSHALVFLGIPSTADTYLGQFLLDRHQVVL